MVSELPPFTPTLKSFQLGEFHEQSLRLLDYPAAHNQHWLDFAPFAIRIPEPPPEPSIPLLAHQWYPKPIQAIRDQALGKTMPPPPVPLYGKIRITEAQRVMRPLLAGNGPVYVQGESGIGKSTLLNFIANHERTRQRYRRIWWLDHPQHVIQSLILILNQGQIFTESVPSQQILLLRDVLSDDTLIIIDNCTPADTERYKILSPHIVFGVETAPEILEPDEPLPEDPENTVTLRALPPEDALEIMIHTSGMTDRNNLRGQMRAWLTHISRLLNGHPLAMVVVGALFKEDALPMERIVELLNTHIDQNAPNPLAILDLSLKALPIEYAQILEALTLLPIYGANVETLVAITKIEQNISIHRALAFLMKHGFVQRNGYYYFAHPLVLARMENITGNSKKFVERLRQWALSLARRNRDTPDKLYRFQQEIFHTIDQAQIQRQNSFIQKIMVPLGGYCREYAPQYLDQDTPAPPLVGERARAATLIGDGLRHLEHGEFEAARVTFLEGLTHTEKHGSDHEIAEALVAVARYDEAVQDYATTIKRLERAARLIYDLRAENSLHTIRLGLAKIYRLQERYKDALSVLDDEPDTIYERVRIHRAMQDWDRLLPLLGQAEHMQPYIKAEAYLQAGHYADALAALSASRDSESSYLRAIIYHLQHDYENAVRGYELAMDAVSKQNSKRIIMMIAMAKAIVSQGDIPKARQVLNQATEFYLSLKDADPVLNGHALGTLAALELMEGTPTKAIALAEQALSMFTNIAEDEYQQERADIYRTLGRAYAQQRQFTAMRTAFEQEVNITQGMPNRDEQRIGIALHHLADAYLALQKIDRAIANYRRALTHKDPTLDPYSYTMTQSALFKALLVEERYGQALEVCQLTIKHLNAYPPADLQHMGYMLCSRAKVEQELDNLDAAFRTLNQWMILLAGRTDALQDERHAVRLLVLSLCIRSLNHYDRGAEAIPLAEEALKIAEHHHPSTPVTWSIRRDYGQAMLNSQNYTQAIDVLRYLQNDEVTRQPFTFALAHKYIAIAHKELNDPTAAIPLFKIAFENHPIDHEKALILELLAQCYVELGQKSEAIKHMQLAIPLMHRQAEPEDAARILNTLAHLLDDTKQHQDSVEIYEDALSMLRVMPDTDMVHTARVYSSLAASHEAQEQYPQAAIAYRNALDTLENDRRGSPDDHRKLLVQLANVQSTMHNYDEAIGLYLQARSETERYGTTAELGQVITSLANTYYAAEYLNDALFSYEEALRIQSAETMPRIRAATLRGYGQTLAKLNKLAEARAAWTEALQITTDAPAIEIALTHRAIGEAFAAQNMANEAEAAYQDAIQHHMNGTPELAETLRLLAHVLVKAERHQDATAPAQKAFDIEKGLPQQVNRRIVECLDLLATIYEANDELSAALTSHHEALVYTEREMQPIQTSNRYRHMGRLYTIEGRWKDAHKSYEAALEIEMQYKPRSDIRIAQTLELIAQTYRREGHLQKAAEHYKRMASYANLSKQAEVELKQTLSTIDRYQQTLEAAQASLEVLQHNSASDVKDLAYVYALIATSYYGLSEHQKMNTAIDQLLTCLEENVAMLSTFDERPSYRALAHLFEGSQAASGGQFMEARAHFQRALHDTTDPSMRWVIERGLESVREA